MKWSQWQRNQELERGPAAGLVFSLVLLFTSSSIAQSVESVSAPILPLPATDGLGRALPISPVSFCPLVRLLSLSLPLLYLILQ